MDASLYDNLPDDPEQAFIILEQHYREICDDALRHSDNNERTDVYYVSYIASVLGAVQELGIDKTFSYDQAPSLNDANYNFYLDFRREAETYARVLAIRHGRRNKQYSVALNADAKSKIRQMLDKLKEEVERLDISVPKKDAIYSKINALEAELNRSRTRYEVVAALWVESCTKFGEGIEKLEPLRKWINPIADLIGQSKGSERNTVTKLAPPPLRRQIEDKRAVPEIRDGIDDDIPF